MQIMFSNDFNDVIEVERVLVKKLRYKWNHLRRGATFLQTKFKDKGLQETLYIVLWDDKTLTWGIGDNIKHLSKEIERIDIKQFLQENK
jgi:hypothetical protein